MAEAAQIHTTADAAREFLLAFPDYLKEVAVAILPIAGMLFLFQLLTGRFRKRKLLKITGGLFYTYTGLVLFLTGVNVGFMPAGQFLRAAIGAREDTYLLIPILRILTGIPILYFLVPGYLLSLLLTFFVPKIYTGIAFDSGSVASSPMTAAFLLPFAMGACTAAGGNILTDAFGVVAMVAMTPLVTIQVLGLMSELRRHARTRYLKTQERKIRLCSLKTNTP